MVLNRNLAVSKDREQARLAAAVDPHEPVAVTDRQLELRVLECKNNYNSV